MRPPRCVDDTYNRLLSGVVGHYGQLGFPGVPGLGPQETTEAQDEEDFRNHGLQDPHASVVSRTPTNTHIYMYIIIYERPTSGGLEPKVTSTQLLRPSRD